VRELLEIEPESACEFIFYIFIYSCWHET
jgi:hypothetical protein